MGNILTSPIHKGTHHGDDESRPTKRRRMSPPESLHIDHFLASPGMSESRSMLRIEVLKILHKDSKKVKSYQGTVVPRDVLSTKARCKVTILDMSRARPEVLHCQSQVCDLFTYKNPVGPHRLARVDLPKPFFVPHESILVNKQTDGQFDLSDSYELLVELEAANGVHWPPLDAQDFGIPAEITQHWILSTRFADVYGRLKSPVTVSARYSPVDSIHTTNYVMDVDLRWTSGFKALRRLEKGSMPCIMAVDPDVDIYNDTAIGNPFEDRVNGTDANVNDEPSQDQEDDFAGDQTPSRSLRAREKNKVYNLKALSDKARGKDPKNRERNGVNGGGEGRVQYMLPSDQPVALDFYRCISCGAYHESIEQLQLHLQISHDNYTYMLESTSQGPQFRVSALRESTLTPRKAYNLGRPVKPFNLQTIVTGDQSWISSRMGVDSYELFKTPSARTPLECIHSGSPMSKASRTTGRRHAKGKASEILVPKIPQPLFHPISKAQLKAGQEVPQTVPDNTWLIQKHRESTSEFSDVTTAEKEYIWEWDGYILRQNITSAAYFARAWLDFVEEKAPWLVASNQRMLEFGKHCSVLLARDALDDEDMQQAFTHINMARVNWNKEHDNPPPVEDKANPSHTLKDTSSKQSPRVSHIRKGANGCTVSQLPVLGPRLLLCSNTVSIFSFDLMLCRLVVKSN